MMHLVRADSCTETIRPTVRRLLKREPRPIEWCMVKEEPCALLTQALL
jgi:hypothetical protein